MNKRSGKTPDILKFLAALSALTTLLAGCQPQTVSDPVSPAVSDSSTGDNTHIPETSDLPSEPESSSGSTDGMSDSSSTDISSSSSDSGSSSTDSSSLSSDIGSSSTDSSSSSSDSGSSSSENSSSSSDSGSASTDSSSSDNSSSSSAESTSEASVPETPESSVEPEPPPVVVIPDVKVPTSPGSQLITGTSGVIDCSNASLGYVSARYTGSSSKLKFRVEANGEKDDYDLSANGSTEYFPLTFGNGTYTLTIFEQLPGSDRYGFAAQGTANVQLSSSLSPYLYPNRYVSYDRNSDCVYKAAELCAGKTDEIDKIAAIFMWVANNISYDYDLSATVTSGYTPDPDRTLAKRTGICFDYSSLMAAMLRSQSIPTRLVIGYAAPDIYHAWNEVYTEQTGWITPELMFNNNGFNLADATFYSSTPDKAQIAAYISNNGNYAATKYR